jgi:glycosyltransferase involved in cell wall biosynthesis
MRILITSYVFHPVIGGITTVSSLLAAELAAAGHEVRVVTATAGLDPEGIHYEVIRNPSPITLWKEVARCDVLLSVHLSVRLAWPLVFLRKPWVIAHHSWLTKVDGSVGFVERLKRALLGSASCISVSQAVANHVDTPSVVIGPPYDEVLFGLDPAITREWNLLFVGRLVSSKGLNVLLEALAELRRRGHTPRLTVVGAGPELPRARELARQLELEGEVDFVGSRTGADLRATY